MLKPKATWETIKFKANKNPVTIAAKAKYLLSLNHRFYKRYLQSFNSPYSYNQLSVAQYIQDSVLHSGSGIWHAVSKSLDRKNQKNHPT